MISRFFINRPIFATVLSIVIALTGFIALLYLPISQYPRITPPGISISISYPGANAQEVADTVGAPIEQQVNGIDGMLYMSSNSGNDGSYQLTVTFKIGTDVNTALVMVQNRVSLAMPLLPSAVQNQGITIRKRTPDMLMIVNFVSPDGRYNDEYLSNYATIYCKDELLRVPGVSDVNIMGQRDYSMRVWLDPQKMASRGITAIDVKNAIANQNIDAPAGRTGQPPIGKNQAFELPIDTLGRLVTPEQFGEIIVKVGGKTEMITPTGKIKQPATSAKPPTGPMPSMSIPNSTSDNSPNGSTSSQMSTDTTSTDMSSGPAPLTGAISTDLTAAANYSADKAAGITTNTNSTMSSMNSTPSGGTQSNSASGGTPGTNGVIDVNGMNGTLPATGTPGAPPPSVASGVVRLRDVAEIVIGAQNYNTICNMDNLPSVGFGLYQLPGTNALDVAQDVRKKMDQLKLSFPEDVEYRIAYDTTTFVRDSVNDVRRTLFESVGLVAIVVLIFLQNWRAAIIPLIAVPVAIFGTFAVMAVMHYSLNNISLFGLVLSIGIVVDDAIVVVENVERWMERGLDAREATRRAMDETTSPIIAVGLVLCAVFVPCAFISGITGQFFRQFAVTIAASTIFSTINSLTFSPALASILLKPHGSRRDPLRIVMDLALGWFFWLFNHFFAGVTWAYGWIVGIFMRTSPIVLGGYAVLLVLTVTEFRRTPTGLIPQQDQGRCICNIQLPDAASLQRTRDATAIAQQVALETEGVDHIIAFIGSSFILQANSPNFASMFIVLKPYDQRQSPHLRDTAIMERMRQGWLKRVPDAQVTVYGSSPVPGLGQAGGFKFMVEDHGGLGVRTLESQMDRLVRRLNGFKITDQSLATMGQNGVPGETIHKLEPLKGKDFDSEPALSKELSTILSKEEHDEYTPMIVQSSRSIPGLRVATTQFRSKMPQYFLDIDRDKVASLGVSLDDVNQTLDIFLGSSYVNSYNDFGRHWQVTIQADGKYRTRIEKINLFEVRNKYGQMVPLSTLVKPREIGGPISVTRYMLYTSAAISGNIAAGGSSGEVIDAINHMAKESLPRTMNIEWTELMYLQILAGNTAIYVFILAVMCVFLALSALYESWALPLAVILVVPMCLLCSVEGVRYTHRDVNIFVQIGFVVLVGLACKNAILIVEFAKHLQMEGGRTLYEATKVACKHRLRPILMTSLAFVFGVLPLVYANGAGQEMRRSLGVAVFSGMLGVTVFGIFLTPVFFFVIQGIGGMKMFSSNIARAIVSYGMATVVGAIVGFSVSRLGLGVMPWPPIIGALTAILIVRGLLHIRRRIKGNGNGNGHAPVANAPK